MKIKLCVKVHKYAHMQIMDIRTIINNIIFVYIHWLGVCMFYMCSTVAARLLCQLCQLYMTDVCTSTMYSVVNCDVVLE